ncbi:OmpA family protein [candidate division WOR-3 bacterium]|nr:OmpA family protein [candidate division WOR-3 bacterium]
MAYVKKMWNVFLLALFCGIMTLYAQIEEVPASQETIEELIPGTPKAEAPAEKAVDAYSGATEMIDPDVTLYEQLHLNGHIIIQGIVFNNDNTLAIESDSCLGVIAKMLTNHPKLNIYIVGHTDNSAGVLSGMITSQKRAEAVMNTLSSRFGIDLDRLFASGVGPLSPITSNETEEGRAKNNRIELVIQ